MSRFEKSGNLEQKIIFWVVHSTKRNSTNAPEISLEAVKTDNRRLSYECLKFPQRIEVHDRNHKCLTGCPEKLLVHKVTSFLKSYDKLVLIWLSSIGLMQGCDDL